MQYLLLVPNKANDIIILDFVVRAFVLQLVDLDLIFCGVVTKTLKAVFTAAMLDTHHKKNSVKKIWQVWLLCFT